MRMACRTSRLVPSGASRNCGKRWTRTCKWVHGGSWGGQLGLTQSPPPPHHLQGVLRQKAGLWTGPDPALAVGSTGSVVWPQWHGSSGWALVSQVGSPGGGSQRCRLQMTNSVIPAGSLGPPWSTRSTPQTGTRLVCPPPPRPPPPLQCQR